MRLIYCYTTDVVHTESAGDNITVLRDILWGHIQHTQAAVTGDGCQQIQTFKKIIKLDTGCALYYRKDNFSPIHRVSHQMTQCYETTNINNKGIWTSIRICEFSAAKAAQEKHMSVC